MSLSLAFFREPRFLVLLIGLLSALGLSALLSLPRLEDPTLSNRFARISTILPGADAERVDSQVTDRLEEEIREVEAIKEIRSFSRPNVSLIVVELKDNVTDMESAWNDVRAKLELAEGNLPEAASKPELKTAEVRAYPFILALRWSGSGEANQAILTRLAEDLKESLFQVRGTEKIDLVGPTEEEVLVSLDQAQLSLLGIGPAQVAEALRSSEARIPSGRIEGQNEGLLLELDTDFDSLESIRQVPIVEAPHRAHLRLGDIAEVRKVPLDPPSEQAVVSGHRAVVIGVYCEDNLRVDRWSGQVEVALEEFRQTLPDNTSLEILFQQSQYVESRFQTLAWNLFLAAAAVTAVIFFMMGWRAALVVVTALPLTTAVVLGGMAFLGIPIHQMSVTGLIIALGLLIDNAIVVTDEMQTELGKGVEGSQALSQVLKKLTVPLSSSTATTVLAFLPIALLPGGVGEFVGSIAQTVIIALIGSLILSLTVLPAILLWLKPKNSHGFQSAWLLSLYDNLLTLTTRRPWIGVLIGLALPVAGFLSASHLQEQFFPPTDRDQFKLVVELPAHATIHRTELLTREIRESLLEHPRVQDIHWFMGRTAPKFYYNLQENRRNTPNYAEAMVVIDSAFGSQDVIQECQKKLDREFPGSKGRAIQLEQGPPFDAPVEFHLYGPDPNTLRALGELVRADLARHPDVVQTRADLSDSLLKWNFDLDQARSKRAELSSESVARLLQVSTDGLLVGHLLDETEELPVRVRLSNQGRQDVQALRNIDVQSAGERIPLENLGQFTLHPDVALVTRRDRRRSNSVQAFLKAGVLPTTVLQPTLERLESGQLALPPGYSFELGGEAAKRNQAVGNLGTFVPALVILMVGSLVLAFRSFRIAAIVGVVGFLSAGLALGSLYLFGLPFGFNAIIGTMGLLGIAINDSTVVLVALLEDPEANSGEPEAVKRVVLEATRHVLATTFTTVAGFLPLLLGADRFWHQLAATIAGGISGATILALFFCPSMFLWFRGRSRKSRLSRAVEPWVE